MNRCRSFYALWIGQSTGNLADSLYILAIVSFVYNVTHSAAFGAIVPVVRLSASVFGGLAAPAVMGRFRLVSLLAGSQGTQALLLAVLAVGLPAWGAGSLYAVWPLIAVASLFQGWIVPSRHSLAPRVVGKEEVARANGLISATDQTLLLSGWALGGMLVNALGSAGVLWVSASLMAVSSLLVLLVRDPVDSDTAGKADGSPSSWRSGWAILFGHPLMVRVALTDFLQFAADTVWIGGIMLAFVRVALHADSTWWGFLNGSYAGGCTVGGLIATMWSRYLLHRFSRTLGIGSLSIAVLTFLFAMSASPLWATVLCFLMGPPYQMREITVRTLLQTRLSFAALPSVLAAHTTLTYLAFGGGALVMGILADHLSIRGVYVLSALISLSVALFSARLGRLDQPLPQSV
jgi:hypothetical protein